jgi:hypothetical protein
LMMQIWRFPLSCAALPIIDGGCCPWATHFPQVKYLLNQGFTPNSTLSL